MASRRRVLGLTAGVLALGGAGLAAAAAAKATQKAVSYQDHPKGGKSCSHCDAFQGPNHCKTVEGYIEASGWCDKFKQI